MAPFPLYISTLIVLGVEILELAVLVVFKVVDCVAVVV
jgi:hypothetical protein